VVSDVAGKLELGPAVLVEWGKESVKFFLGKVDNVGGCFFSKLPEVKLCSGVKGFDSGCGSGQGWGVDDVGVGINEGGFKGIWVDKGDAGVGKQGGVLGGLGNIDIIWAGASGCKEGEAGDIGFVMVTGHTTVFWSWL